MDHRTELIPQDAIGAANDVVGHVGPFHFRSRINPAIRPGQDAFSPARVPRQGPFPASMLAGQ